MLKKFSAIIVLLISSIFFATSFATDYINNFELPEEETSMEEEIPAEIPAEEVLETPEEDTPEEEMLETPEEEMLENATEESIMENETEMETPAEMPATQTQETQETETQTEMPVPTGTTTGIEETNTETMSKEEESNMPTTETANQIPEEEVESEITKEMETEVQTQMEIQAEDEGKTKEILLESGVSEEKAEEVSTLDTEVKTEATEEGVEEVLQRLESDQKISKIESLKLADIIGDEEVSEELKYRIKEVLDTAQSELDSYRTAMKNNYKTMTRRILEVRRELNRVQNFKDEAEYDLEVSRWMILTLSMGVVCLTFLIVVMWRSVTNIGKNELEVLFAYEDLKKNLGKINEQIEILNKKGNVVQEEKIDETE